MYFSILLFAHLKFGTILHQEIRQFFIVYLQVRHFDHKVGIPSTVFQVLKNGFARPWNDPTFFLFGDVPFHRVRFPRSGLAVCKHSRLKTFYHIGNDWLERQVKNFALCRELVKDLIKMKTMTRRLWPCLWLWLLKRS